MPELIEQMYCSQQIVIPPKFPYILKRYCKAAIKTQPYDLLRWSFEYFKALSQNRPPPVKLRLEYPIYSTEGGLTRGCLKVLAQQLAGMTEVPLQRVKAAWQSFCLDQHELRRIFCLCQVYLREDTVPLLHFIAVAGGLLTKTLTHTMILLCETFTKEPDGGSAAIPVQDFLTMYKFLARLDASRDVKYINGYIEGDSPTEETVEEEVGSENTAEEIPMETSSEGSWPECQDFRELAVLGTNVPRTPRLSQKLNMPVLGKIERSPSIERASQIERENYLRERKGRAAPSEDVDKKLREMSGSRMLGPEAAKDGEPKVVMVDEDFGEETDVVPPGPEEEEKAAEPEENEAERIAEYVAECYAEREDRLDDLERTIEDIAAIVDRFKSANYDLGMVAGRQMSTTSGEFIVAHIEKDIMDYINEQIAILPDPDLKKKTAKPEEVAMIRNILETFLDENMDVIVPELEEAEEEELPIPEITVVYAVPGIGPPVDEETMREFIDYALDVCMVQADLFMPRNIRHFLCPPLEKYAEHKYEEFEKKEEVPMAGVITD